MRLTTPDRAAAVVVSQALGRAERSFRAGERDAGALRSTAVDHISAEPRASVEYVEVVDADTLEPVTRVATPTHIAAAAWFGDVRLIDNVLLDEQ